MHSYGGNRGPLYHLADKVEVSPEEVERQKPIPWWYRRQRVAAACSLWATLGTWFMGGEAQFEVTCTTDEVPGIEVDQHSITVCRYARDFSKMETRRGTFTDPWTLQPQPKCGFVFVGTDGTISSYDYEDHVTVQTLGPVAGDPRTRRLLPAGSAAASSTCRGGSPRAKRSRGRSTPNSADRAAHRRYRGALGPEKRTVERLP